MKTIALPLLALAGLFATAPALANAMPSSAVVAPMFALPRVPTQTMPISCDTKLGDLIDSLKAPGYQNKLRANSTVIAGDIAYAESCGTSEGYCVTTGSATYSGSEIVGTSKVGEPVNTARSNLDFRISSVDGNTKIKWTFKGKSYTGSVKSCNNKYWTATTATSAFAVKFSGPDAVAE